MKALTLHAPWAWAICHLEKMVENRTWAPPKGMIGQRIAIHAGSQAKWTLSLNGTMALVQSVWLSQGNTIESFWVRMGGPGSFHAERNRFCSAIVATAIIERVEEPLPGEPRMIGWRVSDQYGWIISDVRVLKTPVKCKGALGFWTVPADVAAEVERMGG